MLPAILKLSDGTWVNLNRVFFVDKGYDGSLWLSESDETIQNAETTLRITEPKDIATITEVLDALDEIRAKQMRKERYSR